MAFLNRVGNLLKQTVSKHVSPAYFASRPSIYQAIRCMSSSSKIFVGGLSYGTDEMSLREAFSQYGEVIEARVILDRETSRSRGFGFVTFTSTEDASRAIQAFDGQDLHGRRIRVNYATERPRGGDFGGGYGGGGGYGQGGNYGRGGYQGREGYQGGSYPSGDSNFGRSGGFGGINQYPSGGGGFGGSNQYPSGGGGFGSSNPFPSEGGGFGDTNSDDVATSVQSGGTNYFADGQTGGIPRETHENQEADEVIGVAGNENLETNSFDDGDRDALDESTDNEFDKNSRDDDGEPDDYANSKRS